MKKKIIYGCDTRGDAESPYLTRWTLIDGGKRFGVYLHRFHRGDADEHHDHPWAFCSIILWRGYLEETPCSRCGGTGSISHLIQGKERALMCGSCWDNEAGGPTGVQRKRVWPGMVLFRRAAHRHRVELVNGREAWTLIIRGPVCRKWGFFTRLGWQHWKEYFRERGCK